MTISPAADATTTATTGAGTQDALAQRLADPKVAGALASILDHADLLALLVSGLDGAVARSEVIGDSLISGLAELRSAAAVPDSVKDAHLDAGQLITAAVSLASVMPKAAPDLSAALAQGSVHLNLMTAGLSRGAADFERDPVPVGGPISMVRLLKDPDIHRAVSFLATVLRALGRELATRPVPR